MKLPPVVLVWPRRPIPLTAALLLVVLIFTFLSYHLPTSQSPTQLDEKPTANPPTPPPPPRGPRYKPTKNETIPPIVDNFPLAAAALSPADLPPIPLWNKPKHVTENTPLFIGFTRNWPILQQAVVSYITAGWPPEDIYVVDNTGVMNSNRLGLLTLQNPFYLDHRRLTQVFGVNVITTPTLLTFAQLQNFYLYTSVERNWAHYFWSHMDVVALPNENKKPYTSLYHRAVDTLREATAATTATNATKWAVRFFAYDRLTLVNAVAYTAVGGWDTMIPFYGTDCDMHERLQMAGFTTTDAVNGLIYDVGASLPDLSLLYRLPSDPCPPDTPQAKLPHGLGDCRYDALVRMCDVLQIEKNSREGGRNFWQGEQRGGRDEPFYRDPEGFGRAVEMTIQLGRDVMREKWGHEGCGLQGAGLKAEDAWRVLGEWEAGEEAVEGV